MRLSSTVVLLSFCSVACQDVTQPIETETVNASIAVPIGGDAQYKLIFFAGTAEDGDATDINDRGEIVGSFRGSESSGPRNFRWTLDRGLEALPGGFIRELTNSGEVLMTAPEGSFIVKQSDIEYIDWGAELEESSFDPMGLRDDGTIVGSVSGPGLSLSHAFVWSDNEGVSILPQPSPHESPNSSANAINGKGVITGYSTGHSPIPDQELATAWIDRQPIMLFPDPEAARCFEGWGVATNEKSAIVGGCDRGGRSPRSAFFWTPEDGGLVLSSPDDQSNAFDINNWNEVVGYHSPWSPDVGSLPRRAYRWTRESGFTWLEGEEGASAFAINDLGWIVGTACASTGCHPALWVPAGIPDVPSAGVLGVRRLAADQVRAVLEAIITVHEERFEPQR